MSSADAHVIQEFVDFICKYNIWDENTAVTEYEQNILKEFLRIGGFDNREVQKGRLICSPSLSSSGAQIKERTVVNRTCPYVVKCCQKEAKPVDHMATRFLEIAFWTTLYYDALGGLSRDFIADVVSSHVQASSRASAV